MKSYECHTGTRYVFTDPKTGIKFHAGGTSRKFKVYEGQLLLALYTGAIDNTILGNIKGLRPESRTVFINWPDMGTPALDKKDWVGLLRAIRGNKMDVAIACMGGHGRTGTALAILGVLTGAIESEPIAWVREHYCQEAVESTSQIKYVADMTGIEESRQVKGSKVYSGSYYSGYGSYGSYGSYYDDGWTYKDKAADGKVVNDKPATTVITGATVKEFEAWLVQKYEFTKIEITNLSNAAYFQYHDEWKHSLKEREAEESATAYEKWLMQKLGVSALAIQTLDNRAYYEHRQEYLDGLAIQKHEEGGDTDNVKKMELLAEAKQLAQAEDEPVVVSAGVVHPDALDQNWSAAYSEIRGEQLRDCVELQKLGEKFGEQSDEYWSAYDAFYKKWGEDPFDAILE